MVGNATIPAGQTQAVFLGGQFAAAPAPGAVETVRLHTATLDAVTNPLATMVGYSTTHMEYTPHASASLIAVATNPTAITLSTKGGTSIQTQGALLPASTTQRYLTLDYISPGGGITSVLVAVNPDGSFQSTQAVQSSGMWQVRAVWQGDLTGGPTVSPSQSVQVGLAASVPALPAGFLAVAGVALAAFGVARARRRPPKTSG
jgi:hypothetical protein